QSERLRTMLCIAGRTMQGEQPPAHATAQKKRAPSGTGLSKLSDRPVLLEAGRDRAELGVQRAAEVVDDGDDRERDAGSDQAVFNGGGAGFILHETRNEVLHRLLPKRYTRLQWSGLFGF